MNKPDGRCQCGCGRQTNVATKTRMVRGQIRGQFNRFIHGHHKDIRNRLKDVIKRFWKKVDKNGPVPKQCPGLGPCWLWAGSKKTSGYGHIIYEGREIRAHRMAVIIEDGSIPEGMLVMHRCDNPPCVRRTHLIVGNTTDNNRDCVAKGRHHCSKKTHCPEGHPYDEGNTYFGKTGRHCRKCKQIRRALQRHYQPQGDAVGSPA